MQNILETNRLILRVITKEDTDHLLALFSDSEAMKYFPGTKDWNETEEWISLVLESYRKNNFGPWAVIQEELNEFIGYCGFYFQKNVDGIDEIEILYGFIRKYWDNGYATEAARGVYQYGQNELKLKRFISLVAPGNIRASRVAEKIGMRLEKEASMWGKQYLVYSIG